jgi:hypothetical protein
LSYAGCFARTQLLAGQAAVSAMASCSFPAIHVVDKRWTVVVHRARLQIKKPSTNACLFILKMTSTGAGILRSAFSITSVFHFTRSNIRFPNHTIIPSLINHAMDLLYLRCGEPREYRTDLVQGMRP